jgi:hypothetical protein
VRVKCGASSALELRSRSVIAASFCADIGCADVGVHILHSHAHSVSSASSIITRLLFAFEEIDCSFLVSYDF